MPAGLVMRLFHFTYKTDSDTGADGWVPDWQPTFDPNTSGLGVAHDILEHFPGTDDSPASEFLALGAMYWGRGRMGMLYRPHRSMVDDTAYTIVPVIETIVDTWAPLPACAARPLPCRSDDIELMEIAERAMVLGKRELGSNGDCPDDDELGQLVDVNRLYSLLVRGYRMAGRRYRHIGPSAMSDLFQILQDAVTPTRNMDYEDGDRMIAHVDVRRVRAHVTYHRRR